MTTNILGYFKYDDYVEIFYAGIIAHTSIQKPLYLGDKPIVGTLVDLDEGYGPNCTGALGFPKMESCT